MQNEDDEVLFIKVGPNQIEHKSAKCEIDLRLVLFMEVDDEFFIVEDFFIVGRVNIAGLIGG